MGGRASCAIDVSTFIHLALRILHEIHLFHGLDLKKWWYRKGLWS